MRWWDKEGEDTVVKAFLHHGCQTHSHVPGGRGPLLAWLRSQFPATLLVQWEVRHSPSHHTKGCPQKNRRGLPRHRRFSGMGLQSDCELESHSETEKLEPWCIETSVIHVFSVLYFDKTTVTLCRIKWKIKITVVVFQVQISIQHLFNWFLQIDDQLSADTVQRACSSTGFSTSFFSNSRFQASIANIYLSNAKVDAVYVLSDKHHFDSETFQEGRDIITAGTHHQFCTRDISDDTPKVTRRLEGNKGLRVKMRPLKELREKGIYQFNLLVISFFCGAKTITHNLHFCKKGFCGQRSEFIVKKKIRFNFISNKMLLHFAPTSIRCGGVSAVKASVKQEKFVAGRWTLGGILHPLQVKS